MARVAVALSCTAEQRAELMALARSRTEETRLVERAKIVLACLEGQRNDAVGREFGVRANTVGLWRKRFAATGLAGKSRCGARRLEIVRGVSAGDRAPGGRLFGAPHRAARAGRSARVEKQRPQQEISGVDHKRPTPSRSAVALAAGSVASFRR